MYLGWIVGLEERFFKEVRSGITEHIRVGHLAIIAPVNVRIRAAEEERVIMAVVFVLLEPGGLIVQKQRQLHLKFHLDGDINEFIKQLLSYTVLLNTQ